MGRLNNAAFFATLLIVSVCLNLALAWQIRSLRRALLDPVSVQAVTGVKLDAIQVSDIDGTPTLIRFEQVPKPTVVYLLHPACGWCARNLENIKALARGRHDSFRFVGLSVTDANLKEYEQKNAMGFPIYFAPSLGGTKGVLSGGTPQMLVVATNGVVTKNWPGALMGDQQKQVEEYFQIKLPGLSTD